MIRFQYNRFELRQLSSHQDTSNPKHSVPNPAVPVPRLWSIPTDLVLYKITQKNKKKTSPTQNLVGKPKHQSFSKLSFLFSAWGSSRSFLRWKKHRNPLPSLPSLPSFPKPRRRRHNRRIIQIQSWTCRSRRFFPELEWWSFQTSFKPWNQSWSISCVMIADEKTFETYHHYSKKQKQADLIPVEIRSKHAWHNSSFW